MRTPAIMNLHDIEPVDQLTVTEIMYRNAYNYPGKEAVVFEDNRLTYRQLDEKSNQAANCMIKMGLQKGDKVSLMVGNSDQFAILYFGILKAGGVVIPVNVRFVPKEVEFILRNSGSRLFLCGVAFGGFSPEAERELGRVAMVAVGQQYPGFLKWDTLLEGCSFARPEVTTEENDLCSIIYTSGTTGMPRGAVFTHRKVALDACLVGTVNHRFHAYTRTLIMMPLSHSAPLHNHFLGTMFAGGTVVILPKFDLELFLKTVQDERITHFFGPAVVYLNCIKFCDIGKFDLSSVQLFIIGGSPVSAADMKSMIDVFGMHGRFMQVYGLTEGGPSGCALFPEEVDRKPSSIGLGGCIGSRLILVDEKQNVVSEPGVVGELAVLSECNMLGYYNDPQKTAETLVSGWVLTGDLGRYDEDGYLYFVDRKKDVIISGGQNVYSKEVEDALMQHPAVKEAAVIGVRHPEWGESVKAIVSLLPDRHATPEEIRDFCRDKLAKFKIPRYVEIVDEIPRNPSGKILKKELKIRYADPCDRPLS